MALVFRHSPRAAMLTTLWALLPGILAMAYLFAYGFIWNLMLCLGAALACEALMLKLRSLPMHTLNDLSAVLTGVLIALALPPHLPWWIPVATAFLAISLGKHAYGGLGNNIFNPAMLGYCLALVAWPLHLTAWPDPANLAMNFTTASGYLFVHSGEVLSEALTGATPLEVWRMGDEAALGVEPLAWHWVSSAFALGGIALLWTKVISWHIPFSMLLALLVSVLLLGGGQDELTMHLLSGATVLGAFFIATDPVTSPRTLIGKLIFGSIIGMLLALIRTYGDYADGLAFAVLIANALVVVLDKVVARGH